MVALLLFCVVDALSNGVCALGGQSAQAWVAVDIVEPIFVLLC